MVKENYKISREQMSNGVERIVLGDFIINSIGRRRVLGLIPAKFTKAFTPEEIAKKLNHLLSCDIDERNVMCFMYDNQSLRVQITSDGKLWGIQKASANKYYYETF